jgi:hypothetical protein
MTSFCAGAFPNHLSTNFLIRRKPAIEIAPKKIITVIKKIYDGRKYNQERLIKVSRLNESAP